MLDQVFELVVHLFKLAAPRYKRQILLDIYASMLADHWDVFDDLYISSYPRLCSQIKDLTDVDPDLSFEVREQVEDANIVELQPKINKINASGSWLRTSTDLANLHVRLETIPFFSNLGFSAPPQFSSHEPRAIFGCRTCRNLRVVGTVIVTDG
jgi:hypothetical protein